MKKWLDNYNDSKASAPEGFQGDGFSMKGRNYSPAWGGQFQQGGFINKRGIELQLKEEANAKKDKEELQRTGQIKNPRSVSYLKKTPKKEEVRTHKPQSALSKGWEVATHPMTAVGYPLRNQSLPDYFSKGDINPHESAVDLINPFVYADQAKQLVSNVAKGKPIDASLNALSLAPGVAEFSPQLKILGNELKTLSKPLTKNLSLSKTLKAEKELFVNHEKLNFEDLNDIMEAYRDDFVKAYGEDFTEKDLGLYAKLREIKESRILPQYPDPELHLSYRGKPFYRPNHKTSRDITESFAKTHDLNTNYSPKETLLADSYSRGYDEQFNARRSFDNRLAEFYNPLREEFENLILKNKTKAPEKFFRESQNFIVQDVWDKEGNKLNPMKFDELLPGMEYMPNSFYSTSLSPMHSNFGSILSEINVPVGQSVLNMNTTGVRNFYHELENVLPSKLRYRIDEVSQAPESLDKYSKIMKKSIVNPYKNGGVIKGVPSEGKFAKKTMPSAQDGKVMESLKKTNPELYKKVIRNNRALETKAIWDEHFEKEKKKKGAKEWVGKSMEEAYKSPLMSPGYFTPEGVAIGALQGAVKLGPDLYKGNYNDAALDALTILPEVGNIAKAVGTSKGLLSQTHKLNPWAFKPSSSKFYRQVDNVTYNEGLESGLIKGKQDVNMTQGNGIINLNKSFGDDAYYNKGSLYYKDNKDLPYLFEADLPEERFIPKVNNRTGKYTTENTSVRVSKEPISIKDPSLTTYKKDWLKGYKKVSKKQYGGIIKDDLGQWAHPGEITEIGSNDITMKGVPYDVLGVSDTGDTKLMKPGKDYKFKGKKVTEFPLAKNGTKQDKNQLVKLDQLTNFTNYNNNQPGGWLDTL